MKTYGCSLSVFYIKPQQLGSPCRRGRVVPYQYSTSNRNLIITQIAFEKLFLISILHQTATLALMTLPMYMLFLISILHQTATVLISLSSCWCCSLSVFYIKPQRLHRVTGNVAVVPYQYSTSNRN